ncbi:MAG TPA: SGNH/GDSL hydrolase family protein [Patescibacteria group bacterium]|nr:SGNH/GDSL hydrolase family protein [Patescibacteria group bacterium]
MKSAQVLSLVKRWLCGLTLACASLLLLCLAIEFTLRFVWTDWKHKWDTTQRFRFKTEVKQNEFRTGPEFFHKDPDTFRIIVLGDSFTFGEGVYDSEDLYTAVLQRRLNQRYRDVYKNIKIEVINLGVCGFTTLNELELLMYKGIRFQPDMVIVQFLSNDTERSAKGYAHLDTIEEFKVRMELLGDNAVHRWLIAHSYLYAFLNEKYRMLQYIYKIPLNHGFKDDYHGWIQCQQALSYMTAFCMQHDLGRPVMMIFPFFIPGKWNIRNFPERIAHEKIRQAATQSGFYVMDLLPLYLSTGRNLRSFWALPLNQHPSAEAHAMAAAALEEFLVSCGIIEPRLAEFSRARGKR